MRRKLMYLILAGGLALGAAACEDPANTSGGEERPTPAEGTSAPEPTDGAEDGADAAAPPPDGVIASREVTDSGSDLKIDVTSVRRQGEAITLSWRIALVSGNEWRVGDKLGTGLNDFTASGVTLVDPVNAQRYLVARSGGEDGECACTGGLNFYMAVGDEVEFFANYAAPPSDVATVNVEFPKFGAFTDVPIS